MSHLPTLAQTASSSTDGGTDFLFYVVLAAAIGVTAVVMQKIFSRRAQAKITDAGGGIPGGITVRIAPAPPFPDQVAQVRALLGDTSPTPRITRYTVPVVTTDAASVRIRAAKIGDILTIPFDAISAIDAGDASIKPKGTLITQTFPSVWLTIATPSGKTSLVLTPVTGAYEKVRGTDAEAIAEELRGLRAASPR